MERKQYQELINELVSSDKVVDNELVDEFLARYPYANPVRVLRAFRKARSGKDESELARREIALFSTLTFSFPFVYDAWQGTFTDEQQDASVIQVVATEEQCGGESVLDAENEVSKERTNTKPSRYHDDLMPFSFLWWLNKTRIEFADTYQPYAQGQSGGNPQPENQVDVIDQQIKENIFHMQSPEALLSDSSKKNTVSFEINKKEYPVIEKFIKEEPQIKPPSATKINLENKARRSAEDESGFVSETLAKIYAEQGLYLKAIETYKKLSLKFPEKSPYFAKLIEKLNEKIN